MQTEQSAHTQRIFAKKPPFDKGGLCCLIPYGMGASDSRTRTAPERVPSGVLNAME